MALRAFGEKWDLAQAVDVDLDGDLDVVANDEEWWENGRFEVEPFAWQGVAPSSVSVVWFENPHGELPRTWREREGRIEIEAEEATRFDDGSWVERGRYAGFHGDGYLHAHNALHPAIDHGVGRLFGALGERTLAGLGFEETRGARYALRVAGGEYVLWLRCFVPARFGYGLGGEDSDAVWVGVDGEGPQAALAQGGADAWRWVRAPRRLALAAGEHALVLRVAERGFAVDRIVLASDEGFMPAAEERP
jgi:hypothetical protein